MYRKGFISNYSNVDDPVLKEMLIAMQQEIDPDKRQELLNEIQKYEACQRSYVHWPIPQTVTCWQPWVRDYQTHAISYHSGRVYEHVWFTEDAPGRKVTY